MRIHTEDLLEIDGVKAPVDLSANAALKPMWLGYVLHYAIQLTITGTPNGTFKLQGSNDEGRPDAASEAEQAGSVTTWTDLGIDSGTVSAAGTVLLKDSNVGYRWVRVVWTAAGPGTTPVLTEARSSTKGA